MDKKLALSVLFLIFILFILPVKIKAQQPDKAIIAYAEENNTEAHLLNNLLGHFQLQRKEIKLEQLIRVNLQKYDFVFIFSDRKIKNQIILNKLDKFEGTVCWIVEDSYYYINNIISPAAQKYFMKNRKYKYHNILSYYHYNNHWFINNFSFWDIKEIVFSDLLHDILRKYHSSIKKVLVRIEDVHPHSDPVKLKKMADVLIEKNLPFAVNLIPVYNEPELSIRLPLDYNKKLLKVLQYIQKNGGSIILHGYTHCLPGDDSSGEGYEFWNPGSKHFTRNKNYIESRILLGIKELKKHDIRPAAFCPPHYAFPVEGYKILSNILPVLVGQKQINNSQYTQQEFPYIINNDRHKLTIIPENLGYITEKSDIEKVISKAKKYSMVRDSSVGFFYHWFLPPGDLKYLVNWFKTNNYKFIDLKDYRHITAYAEKKLKNVKDNKLIKPPHYWSILAVKIILLFCLSVFLYGFILYFINYS